eukprot:6213541-Pleurochrysis_carterae.AAC.2
MRVCACAFFERVIVCRSLLADPSKELSNDADSQMISGSTSSQNVQGTTAAQETSEPHGVAPVDEGPDVSFSNLVAAVVRGAIGKVVADCSHASEPTECNENNVPEPESQPKPALNPQPAPLQPLVDDVWTPMVGEMCEVKGEPGYIWSVRQNVGVVFNDPVAPWQGFLMADITQNGKKLAHPDEHSLLASFRGNNPLGLPVQGVVNGKVEMGSDDAKCPSGTLRGKWAGQKAAECKDRCWDLYLAYVPGQHEGFSKSPIDGTISTGQRIYCRPPFVTSALGRNTAPPTDKARVGTLLGIMIGEEHWKASKGSKAKSQQRRFTLVAFDDGPSPCYVAFERVQSHIPDDYIEPKDPPPPPRVEDCMATCMEAAMVRKPGAVHQADMVAVQKLAQLQAAKTNGEEDGGFGRTRQKGKGCGGKDRDGGDDGKDVKKSSGIPKGLVKCGVGQLNALDEATLILVLQENNPGLPPADVVDRAGCAKDQLLRKFKHRGYKGYIRPKKAAKRRGKATEKSATGKAKAVKPIKVISDSDDDDDDDDNDLDDALYNDFDAGFEDNFVDLDAADVGMADAD